MSGEYRTRHISLAAFLRYVLGDPAHRETAKTDQGYSFAFSNKERCFELADAFHSEEGASTANAKELLQVGRSIAATMRAASNDPDGIWISDIE